MDITMNTAVIGGILLLVAVVGFWISRQRKNQVPSDPAPVEDTSAPADSTPTSSDE